MRLLPNGSGRHPMPDVTLPLSTGRVRFADAALAHGMESATSKNMSFMDFNPERKLFHEAEMKTAP